MSLSNSMLKVEKALKRSILEIYILEDCLFGLSLQFSLQISMRRT